MLRWRGVSDCINKATEKQYRASEGLENPLKTKPDICSGGGVEQIALAAKTKGPQRA